MKKYVLWYITLNFIAGLGFGYLYNTGKLKPIKLGNSHTLKVLCPEGLIPVDLFESFQVENGMQISLQSYASNSELLQLVHEPRRGSTGFDIILLSYTQIPELVASGNLLVIDMNYLKNINNLAADFRDLPTDPGGRFSIPILWGVGSDPLRIKSPNKLATKDIALVKDSNHAKGFIKDFSEERQYSSLWVQSFVIPRSTANLVGAYDLVNYFLNRDVALELTKLTNRASTNTVVEHASIASQLKPSHLRNQNLARMVR